jgi:hypothetical protein
MSRTSSNEILESIEIALSDDPSSQTEKWRALKELRKLPPQPHALMVNGTARVFDTLEEAFRELSKVAKEHPGAQVYLAPPSILGLTDAPASQLQDVPSVASPPQNIQGEGLFVPKDVQLDAEFLTWPVGATRVTYRRPAPDMLRDFVRLCDSPRDSAVRAYARKWGVLGICERHGLPCSHGQSTYGLYDGAEPCLPMLVTPLPPDGSDFRHKEPIAVWRLWSSKAKALLTIAAELNEERIPSVGDWQVLKELHDSGLGETEHELFMETVANARVELAAEVDRWISYGQVHPHISWEAGKPRFTMAAGSGPNLFGMLALEIAYEVASPGKGIAVCCVCQHTYPRERRTSHNNREYCPGCRDGKRASWRESKREQRRRERGKGRQ